MTDKALMTLMLYGECRGESQFGKLCVASTVMNRLYLSEDKGVTWWGNSIETIIKAPMQYQGFVNRDPSELENDEAYKACRQIAIAVLDFGIVVPEITHFVTIDYPDFIGMEYKFTVGNHKFFKEKY